MRMSSASLAVAALSLFAAGVSNASSVSYYMNQSNVTQLPDGTDYLKVTISDAVFGLDLNAIKFQVDILSPLTSIAGTNFGIQIFGFNTLLDVTTVNNAIDLSSAPGWSKGTNTNANGFGNFELIPSGGSDRQNPLIFYITGISGDLISDYTTTSTGGGQGTYYFAAHVAGFLDVDPGAGEVTSAYFGGNSYTSMDPVPVPAAAWLFGSAFGLLGLLRRKTTI